MTATAPEGHGTQYGTPVEPLTGPHEAAEWVRARKAEGSDWIKIIYEDGSAFDMEIPSLDGETVAAVIEAAHAEGLAAVVHVSTLETALEAMAFGADGLVHVWRDEVVAEGGDVAIENVRRLRAAGVRLVAGTDSPNPGTGMGISMHGELRLLARAGMGSAEARAAGLGPRSRPLRRKPWSRTSRTGSRRVSASGT